MVMVGLGPLRRRFMQQSEQGALHWRKASYSGSEQTECVEVGQFSAGADTVAVRDTKARGAGPVLGFTAEAWGGFLADVKSGRFAV
jgi:Domain of unknown function (DUF397)